MTLQKRVDDKQKDLSNDCHKPFSSLSLDQRSQTEEPIHRTVTHIFILARAAILNYNRLVCRCVYLFYSSDFVSFEKIETCGSFKSSLNQKNNNRFLFCVF